MEVSRDAHFCLMVVQVSYLFLEYQSVDYEIKRTLIS
jgi:hypothetical protein